jgi:alkylation response protein AidB-like acyl-CoA dehydrogenase
MLLSPHPPCHALLLQIKLLFRRIHHVNAEQRWIKVTEEVAGDVLARHADEVDAAARWPSESVTALGKAGLLGLTLEGRLGGAGAGPATFATVVRILAQQCASTAMIYLMHACATQVIAAAPTLARREPLLRDITAGRHLSTLAFSEKGSRSHFWAPISQAIEDGSQRRISAQKSWVTSAGHADSYIVSTRAAGASEPLASTLYFVPADAAGLAVDGPWNGLGLRGNASAPVRLTNVAVPATDEVSSAGQGFATMMQTVLPWFQIGSAAVSLGIAQSATQATRNHLRSAPLEHLGHALAGLPNLRTRLAQMQILVDTQQAFLDQVADRMQNPDADTLRLVLESKASAAEAALHVTDLAMRTCGGAAFSKHLSVERNFRDARAGWVMAPTTDILYDFIGKTLLDLPLF